MLTFCQFINENNINSIVSTIKKNLTPDLLKSKWKKDNPEDFYGYCYVATEALWWILGGPDSQYYPYVIGHMEWPEVLKNGQTHWFLKNKFNGEIIDITKNQFGNKEIPYSKSKPNGMMCFPVGGSKRAKILINRIKNINI